MNNPLYLIGTVAPLSLTLSHKGRGDAPMPQGSVGSLGAFPLPLWERARVRGLYYVL